MYSIFVVLLEKTPSADGTECLNKNSFQSGSNSVWFHQAEETGIDTLYPLSLPCSLTWVFVTQCNLHGATHKHGCFLICTRVQRKNPHRWTFFVLAFRTDLRPHLNFEWRSADRTDRKQILRCNNLRLPTTNRTLPNKRNKTSSCGARLTTNIYFWLGCCVTEIHGKRNWGCCCRWFNSHIFPSYRENDL